MSTITLNIPDDLNQRLEALSREVQQPPADLVRELLRRYLIQEELRIMRDKLRPYAEAQGFLTDDDVFKAVS